MADLPNEQMGNATGIFNLMRNIGGSFGISIVTTMLARGAQVHQTYIAAHFNPYNPVFQRFFWHSSLYSPPMALRNIRPTKPCSPSTAWRCSSPRFWPIWMISGFWPYAGFCVSRRPWR